MTQCDPNDPMRRPHAPSARFEVEDFAVKISDEKSLDILPWI
jgi:hypothetical protein